MCPGVPLVLNVQVGGIETRFPYIVASFIYFFSPSSDFLAQTSLFATADLRDYIEANRRYIRLYILK